MEKQMVHQKEKLDPEWVNLIMEALKSGITETEIKLFLRQEIAKQDS
ncbi:anti-repressor SinI family protein [Alkalihalobacillus sp. AL-G]|nr:anti-repressor SinI family protein [Alkalihalobacillus sp. AL-G]WLD93835.1 anti-repressor SinI family protein [Alkalihalobacillus sp. AL-G]